jgi:hypothetical protein
LKFNGWQRLGIICSVIWFLGGGFWGNKMAIDEGARMAGVEVDNCVASNKLKFGENGAYSDVWTPCWKEFPANYVRDIDGHWWSALLVGLGPIPFAWLIAWGAIALTRWVRRGFVLERGSNL